MTGTGTSRRRGTTALMTGCAIAALIIAAPQRAAAQSFNGTPEIVAGSGGVGTGASSTNVQVFGPETVINWYSLATGSAINFQPAGTTATFLGPRGGADYTVLNRILPRDSDGNTVAATVAFNGAVNSFLGDGATVGGNIWFYSPTGIIAGPTATFNVGSLILTTDDIQFVPGVPDVSDGSIYGAGGLVQFRGTAGSKGFVEIQPGAQINANGVNSYVALVAPRVQQGGLVSANGPIGYIGAEQVDMTINAGLFDISILAGTTDANGVVHTGTTTGPASTGGSDQQQIMMVALPKTTALTMLLSGSIGYTPAASAFDDGSSVVLSAGYGRPTPLGEQDDSLGHMAIDNASFANPVSAYATGSIAITGANGPVSFGSHADMYAGDAITVSLTGSQSLTAADYLSFNAGRLGQGGTVDIAISPKASFSSGSYIDLNASSRSVPYDGTVFGDANGGTVTVDVDGGSFSAAGGLSTDVGAFAGDDEALGGTARAGTASFTARGGGSISASSFSANLDAFGGASDDTGGDAFGGTVNLTSQNGALDLGGLYLEGYGFGGDGTLASGAATGGKAAIALDGGTYAWSYLDAYMDAHAGYGEGSQGNGATARSDAINLALGNGAALTVDNEIDLTANAEGSFYAPEGASVQAGGIGLSITGGSSLAFDNLTANAKASINQPLFFDGAGPSRTPDAFGGTISLAADNGSVSGSSVSLVADANELAAVDSAGTARGGTVDMSFVNGSSLVIDGGEGGLTLSANGYGAIGQSAANAFGGSAALTISDSSVDVNGYIDMSASALANNTAIFSLSGSDPVGFNATGGSATVQLLPGTLGTASLTASGLSIDASGDASTPQFYYNGGEIVEPGYYGGPFLANGGTGTGGTATLNVGGGNLSLDYASIAADGYGGLSAASEGGTAFRSGDGHGGSAGVTIGGGSSALSSLYLSASGFGGDGSGSYASLPALAGDGFGGNASLTISGGSLQADTLSLDASGTGGYGGNGPYDGSDTPATDGGNGTGGAASLISSPDSTGQLTISSVSLSANGTGGTGGQASLGNNGSGGGGTGGTATLGVGGGTFSIDEATVNADGYGGLSAASEGGLSGNGGLGTGGTAMFSVSGGSLSLGDATISADGYGGLSGASEGGTAFRSGNGHGGTAAAVIGGGVTSATDLTISAAGFGGDGSYYAYYAQPSLAGDGFGGNASLTLSGGTLEAETLNVNATGTGGVGGTGPYDGSDTPATDGGNGTGGNASLISTAGGTGQLTLSSLSVSADGAGGDGGQAIYGNNGNGGIGTGGTATLGIGSGDFSSGDVTISADGYGGLSAAGEGGTALRSGDGHGGSAAATIGGGTSTVPDLYISAAGLGGDASSAGGSGYAPSLAGDGFGGNASLTFSGGTLQVDTLTLDATGLGGAGGSGPDDESSTAGTNGGNGTGGTARLISTAGSTGQLTAPSIAILATGTGGAGGEGTLAGNGNGGNGIGGTAGAQLADGAFALGPLNLLAEGYGGAGDVGGVGSGGSAQFVLSDSASGPSGDRTIDGLQLSASGSGGLGTAGTAESDAGSALLTLSGHAGAPLVIDGDLGVTVAGTHSAAGDGFTAAFSGEPVQVTGNTTIFTTRDATLTATSALQTAGDLAITARKLSGTGQFSAGGSATVEADQGIALGKLSAGTTTSLQALNGAILVATDLESGDDVSALGRSIDITSLGALSFASAQATAGDLRIATQGNLTLPGGTATGNVDLSSAAGSFFTAGTISGGGNVSIAGATGLTAPTVVSGGTTNLSASNGAVSVSFLTSPGAVTASGRSIDISSPGALTFTSANATAGNLRLATTGNLALTNGSASGSVNLASASGSVVSTGLITSGGGFAATGATGLSFGSISSGGTTTLSTPGAILVATDLESSGNVSATARSIDITSLGALSFATAQASAGALRVHSAGNLTFASGASATGAVDLASSGGALAAGSAVTSGGALSASGRGGVTFGTLTSGSTTSLASSNGTIAVGNLTSPGLVSAVGKAVTIAAAGPLSFTNAQATGGDLAISTGGNLALASASAAGAVSLASTGGTVSASGPVSSGAAFSASGGGGVTFGTLASGGTTSLASSAGAVTVTNLASAGLVRVNAGGAIAIGSSAGLRFDSVKSLGATTITAADDLAFNTIDSAANLTLKSTGGSLTTTGSVIGGFTQVSALKDITFGGALTALGDLGVDTRGAFVANGTSQVDDATIVADRGITMGSLQTGELTRLTASNGNILVGNLDSSGRTTAEGLDVDISSTGSLNFDSARATSDDLKLHTGGDLTAQTLFGNHAMTLTAGGTFALTGDARGFDISVTSGDIDLGDEARLGARDVTSEIALYNGHPSQETFIGGAANAGGYSLDAAEALRLFADKGITLGVAPGELAPDEGHVTVGDLSLAFGSGNIGGGGYLEISSPTTVSIVGNVALTTAGATDRFIIDPTRVELNTDTGSIAMLDGGSNPMGQLQITGGTIAVGTASVLGQLRSLSDIAAISALLDTPGGAKSDSLRAGSMTFNVADGLFIQNSGASTAFADRHGFSANSLDIVTGSAATRIAINGVILQGGTPVTGLDTKPLVTINGQSASKAGQFDSRSTINGCALGADCGLPPPPPPDTIPDFTPPGDDDLTPPVTPGNPGEGALSGTLVQLEDNQPLIDPPLVDEPITGVGNDDLWVPPCKPEPGQQVCAGQDDTK